MSAQNFIVTEHTTPCQHIRGFPHAVEPEDAILHLAVKEYRPRNYNAQDGSVTIIASHANGFPKETYEPLWDDLLAASENSFKIRAIWIADNAHQGASYAKNEAQLGDDPDWLDHSRDLLLMVNQFREKMVAPIVGLAHSMGCAQIAHLSILHPRLFRSLILIDPVILDDPPVGPNAAMQSSMRRETWPSREQAERSMFRNPFFRAMDPRALKAYVKHALRDLPDGRIVLSTPKAQEAWSYVRPNFYPLPPTDSVQTRNHERMLQPDLEPFSQVATASFVRPESQIIMDELPRLRPRTLWVHGEKSHINVPTVKAKLLAITGTGRGGSGGHAEDCVAERVIEGASHLVCFEKPRVVAAHTTEWLEKELHRWQKERTFWATTDSGKSKGARKHLSDAWMKAVKKDAKLKRTRTAKL